MKTQNIAKYFSLIIKQVPVKNIIFVPKLELKRTRKKEKINMRQYSNANGVIKILVLLADFVILNFILLSFIKGFKIFVPAYFYSATKITVLTANFALAISEQFFSTLVIRRKIRFKTILSRTIKLCGVQVCLFFILLRFLSDGGGMFNFAFLFFAALWFTMILSRYAERYVLKRYRSKGRNTRKVLFVGNDPAVVTLYKSMVNDPSAGYRVIGYFSDKNNRPIAKKHCPKGLKYLGTGSDLDQMLEDNPPFNNEILNVDKLFCCLSHTESKEVSKIVKFCDRKMIHFYYVPREFIGFRLKLSPEYFGDTMAFTNFREPLSYLGNRILKRTFDICFSTIASLCILPFFPFIVLGIKLSSKGPVFFRQERTGLNGKTFECIKFRSMDVNKDADQIQATKDDPRKFAFGNFMRKTNIDELPQFINVLMGNMSVIGPRPHMLLHTEEYSKLIDKYMIRHFCKPGITGWAQVTGFRGETKELWQMEGRIERDIWYIENWSPWLDLKITFMTIKSIIIPDGHAY